jgi:hypothetical protein
MNPKQIALSLLVSLVLFAPAGIAKSKADKGAEPASKTEAPAAKGDEKKAEAKKDEKKAESKKDEKKSEDKKEASKADTGADKGKKGKADAAQAGKGSTATTGKDAAADKEHEGMTFVKGYTKKDGTKVEGYWRKKSDKSEKSK